LNAGKKLYKNETLLRNPQIGPQHSPNPDRKQLGCFTAPRHPGELLYLFFRFRILWHFHASVNPLSQGMAILTPCPPAQEEDAQP
jgi:hypothetical protein